jgi:hypothetical protein
MRRALPLRDDRNIQDTFLKDRITVFCGALLSLLLVYVLLTPREIDHGTERISRPTSVDAGDYGLLGLKTWLEKSGVPTLSWMSRYERLRADASLPAHGNLLITSLPHGVPARARELRELYQWLYAGNHILFLAAEYDSPDWSPLSFMRFSSVDTDEVLRQFGFEFRYPETAENDAAKKEADTEENAEPSEQAEESPGFFRGMLEGDLVEVKAVLPREQLALIPILDHPRLRAVKSVETKIFDTGNLRLKRENPPLAAAENSYALALGLLRHPETGEAVFWEAPLGKGAVWLSAYPDLFGNLTLGMADNSKLLANLLTFALKPGGYVLFDDFHFGISRLYDPQAFFADKRLHYTLLFIVGFWIVYLLGYTNRLGPPARPAHVPKASDFVEVVAGLCARRLSATAVTRGLTAHFFNEVRALYHMPENGQPLWELLEARFAFAGKDLDLLRVMVANCDRGRPPKLQDLISVLQKLRKQLR